MSFHSHASDATTPSTIAGVLLHLANLSRTSHVFDDGSATSAKFPEHLRWRDVHRQSPRFAILSGSYGAGYGSLVAMPNPAAVAKLLTVSAGNHLSMPRVDCCCVRCAPLRDRRDTGEA